MLNLGRVAVLQAASRKAAGPKDYNPFGTIAPWHEQARVSNCSGQRAGRTLESLWRGGSGRFPPATEMAVVYISGDSAAEWAINGVPNDIMLEKPFAMAEMITAVDQLNDRSTGPASA